MLQGRCVGRGKPAAKPSHCRARGLCIVGKQTTRLLLCMLPWVTCLPMEKYEGVLSQLRACCTQTDHSTDFCYMQMFRLDIKNQGSFVNIDSTKRVIKEDRSVCLFFRMMDCSLTFVCIHRCIPVSSPFLR